MKTILVRYYNPCEVMEVSPSTTEEEIKKYCFRANRYSNETAALIAYAETPCTWSTLLDDVVDPKELVELANDFINEAYQHIKAHDYDWLEQHFT